MRSIVPVRADSGPVACAPRTAAGPVPSSERRAGARQGPARGNGGVAPGLHGRRSGAGGQMTPGSAGRRRSGWLCALSVLASAASVAFPVLALDLRDAGPPGAGPPDGITALAF